jgi:hypothetical protein
VSTLAETRGARQARLRAWSPRAGVSVGLAAVVVAALLLWVVARSRSAWVLLGAGHPLVPEPYLPVSGYFLVLATTFGQALGWAAGSALIVHVLWRLGIPCSWTIARGAMSAVYLGLAAGPLVAYHLLYGGWLLGLPRDDVPTWLAAHHPDARWLLVTMHPVIDGSLGPLAALFLGLLWLTGEAPRRSAVLQALLALALLGTCLAVALSLAIHSTLTHIRLP